MLKLFHFKPFKINYFQIFHKSYEKFHKNLLLLKLLLYIPNLHDLVSMAQMPALIPKEVEIQRLKKIWLIVIAMGSTCSISRSR